MPTPSITARNIAHMIAPFLAAFSPPRMAKEPPVKNPAMTMGMVVSLRHPQTRGLRPARRERHWDSRLTSIIWIFLLSYSFDSTIVRREQPTPNAKISPQYWRPCFDGCESTYPPLAIWTVSEPFNTMPQRAADCLEIGHHCQ